MLDENKVRLMTRLSIFEKNEKANGLVMSKFFEQDYVRFNALKTLVAATVVYWIIVGSYVFISFETILSEINNLDYFGVMYRILGWYVMFCFVYFVFAYLLYSYRYRKNRHGLTQYNSDLRDLIELSGGPMHHGKLVKNSNINVVKENETKKNTDPSKKRTVVNKSEMLNNRLKQEEEAKSKQIIENARRLEERNAKKKAMEEQKQKDIEEAKRQIRERRMALEEEQKKMRMQEYAENYKKGDNR